MASLGYPERSDLKFFIELISSDQYPISKYLPKVDEDWYDSIIDCIEYVKSVDHYRPCEFYEKCARLLYKIVKKHELTDANKRSGVIVVYLFCLLNDHAIIHASALKGQAKRIARTLGRKNEDKIISKVAISISTFTQPIR